jgi:hypothetical protein
MIKLSYEQKQYTYEHVGAQPYDMKVQMELKQDANLTEAIAMYMEFLKVATYRINKENIIEAVNDYFDYDYYR